MSARGEPTPVIIAQPQAPSPQLASKDAILFDQIRQGLLLLTIQPADQRGEQHPQEKHVNHGGRVYRINQDQSPKAGGPSYGTLRGSEWPLVLELPAAAAVRVTGRVERCEPADVSLPAGAVLQRRYRLAFRFVDLSTASVAVLAQVCDTAADTGEATG